MQDLITVELKQIVENWREDTVGPCPDWPECNCSYCCAMRALALREKELKRQTTIIGAQQFEVKTEMIV